MTAWIQTLLMLALLAPVYGGPHGPQEGGYRNSLHLTRLARTRVSQLLRTFKQQQLGDAHFEDRSLHLNDLPTLSTDLHRWLSLEERERLSEASDSLQIYWGVLQGMREQILAENHHPGTPQGGRTALSLPNSLHHVQLDLRDLMRRLQTLVLNTCCCPQRTHIHTRTHARTHARHAIVPRPSVRGRGGQTAWLRRLEVYVVLRDLDLYLTKTARDLLLLEARRHGSLLGVPALH
uniref:Uncharacterized protein n=1 Tax=Gadus morhua TaxID=8049 RepID=A0A8C5BX43_GADMO